jgi:hypothetical protein
MKITANQGMSVDMHRNKLKPFFFILTTIGALTIANSSFAFDVSQDTALDRDYFEPFVK